MRKTLLEPAALISAGHRRESRGRVATA